jgi:hypothetical protein
MIPLLVFLVLWRHSSSFRVILPPNEWMEMVGSSDFLFSRVRRSCTLNLRPIGSEWSALQPILDTCFAFLGVRRNSSACSLVFACRRAPSGPTAAQQAKRGDKS